MRNYSNWTKFQLETLARLWPIAPREELLAAFPTRRYETIGKKAASLGLRRSREIRSVKSDIPIIRALVELRQQRRIQRKELAAHLGQHVVHVAKWERGELKPKLANLLNWCDALGVELTIQPRSHSSVWSEHRPVTAKVAGSNPVGGANTSEGSSVRPESPVWNRDVAGSNPAPQTNFHEFQLNSL